MKPLPQIAVALVARFTRAWPRSHPRGIELNTLGDLRCAGFAYFVVSILCLVFAGLALAQSPLPDSFNPGANGSVVSLAVQADGKILVGGEFSMLGGQSRHGIGRLNADGRVGARINRGAGALGKKGE